MKILVLNVGSSSQKSSLYELPDAALLEEPLPPLWEAEIDAVGHRVVHGGRDYLESTLITDDVKAAINRLAALAPAHNPANLEGITAVEQVLPTVPQVAVFDTAFHAHMPPAATVYPGPY